MQVENRVEICLNPDCTFDQSRILRSNGNQEHREFGQCRKWMLAVDNIKVFDVEMCTKVLNCAVPVLSLDFNNQPIQSLKMLSMLNEVDWMPTVQYYLSRFRKKITKKLDSVADSLVSELQKTFGKADCYKRIIQVLVADLPEDRLNQRLSQQLREIQPILEELAVKKIFDQHRLEEVTNHVCDEISRLQQAFIHNHNINFDDVPCADRDEQRFRDWVNEEVQNPFSKIQILLSTFDKPNTTFKVQGNTTSLKCFLCQFTVKQNAQQNNRVKRKLSLQLIQHIASDHFDQTFSNYRRKILKSFLRQVNFKQMIKEVKSGTYTIVEIIDRENAGRYEASEESSEVYVIQVMAQRNQNLAQGRHILAKSTLKDAADILIVFMVKQLFNLRKLQIRLVTKDHFGQTMKEICDYLEEDLVLLSVKK